MITATAAAKLRRRAWRKRGILTIEIDTVENAWGRQVLVNLTSRLYGARGQEHAQAAVPDRAHERNGLLS